jgi:phospholipid/cholesterol/gamma-HCH transport system substrate-binding protein
VQGVAGGLVLAGAIAFVVVGLRAATTIPFQGYYRLNARLANAAGLNPHDQVRMDGQIVGQVLSPHVAGGAAELELQLYDSVRPLRSDTKLIVRARSALGAHYVEIVPGPHGRALPDGATIGVGQTTTRTDLDRLLDMLDAPTRAHVRQLLGELGAGVLARGPDITPTIAAGPTLLAELRGVSDAVTVHGSAAESLLVNADRLAATADPVRGAIAAAIRQGARVAGAVAAEESPLGQAIADGPATTAALSGGLPRVDPLIVSLGGLASASLPLLAAAPSALTQAPLLLRALDPGLRRLGAPLRTLGSSTAPLLALLRRLMPVLAPADAALTIGTRLIGAIGGRPCDFSRMLQNVAQMMAIGNDAGGTLRFQFVAGTGLPGTAARTDPYPPPCQAGRDR